MRPFELEPSPLPAADSACAEAAVELIASDGAAAPGELAYCTPAYVLMETGAAAAALRLARVAPELGDHRRPAMGSKSLVEALQHCLCPG